MNMLLSQEEEDTVTSFTIRKQKRTDKCMRKMRHCRSHGGAASRLSLCLTNAATTGESPT